MRLLILIFLMILWPGLAYTQDTGSIYDTGAERVGYYRQQGNRIEVFDKS